MNEFREKLLGGKKVEAPLLRTKAPRAEQPLAEDESFAELSIPREAARVANHRDSDRHRLENETVEIVHDGRTRQVTLVNLSGGGAMIEGGDDLRLWDRVELKLGDWNRVEAAVRWIKNGRIGLEFAHETRIETDTEQLAQMLQAVLERAVKLLGVDGGELAIFDEPTGELVIAASKNMETNAVGTRMALGEGAMGRVAQTHEPLIIPQIGRAHV